MIYRVILLPVDKIYNFFKIFNVVENIFEASK